MDSLFTKATVLLTQEYVQLYSNSHLVSKLSEVSSATGVSFSKAKETYALSGTWEQVTETFRLLQLWHENTTDGSQDDLSSAPAEVLQTERDAGISGEIDTCVNKPNNHADLLEESDHAISDETSVDILEESNQKNCDEQRKESQENDFPKLHPKHVKTAKSNNRIRPKELSDKCANHPKHVEVAKSDVKSRPNGISKKSSNKCANHTIGANADKNESKKKKETKSNLKSKSLKSVVRKNVPKTKEDVANKTTKPASKVGKTVKKSSCQFATSCCPVETKEAIKETGSIIDSDKKDEEKSDKENQQDCPNADSEIPNPNDSKKKPAKKPGDKGYWSRVRMSNYNEKHQCAQCGVILKSRKRYMEHIRRIHVKEFQCDVCFRRFGYPTDLHRHKCPGIPDPENKCKSKGGRPRKEKVSVPQVTLPCTECDYVGTSQKRLSGHIRRNHRLTQVCDLCDKKFGFLRDLERHKLSVHTKDMFCCDRCSKMYKSKTVFLLHLKTHEEGYVKEKYACEKCGKLFTTKYSLHFHNKMEHLGLNREYLCQVCGKKFRQRNSYKQHMNAHNGVKPYVCDFCGKGFTYHKSLKEHKYMHDNIRRFQCKVCEKTFRQKTTLQIHMKVHKTIKDHICTRCGKGFSQKQALERHERIHSGIKPYTCISCQRTFGDASTIRRHMKAIHQKTDTNWRDDIICNLKRKTDYYVLGGTGQNRTYKSMSKHVDSQDISRNVSIHEINKIVSTQEVNRTVSTSEPKKDAIEQNHIQPQSSEPTVLSMLQADVNHQSNYKPAYTFTDLNSQPSLADHHSSPQTSSVFGISTAQLSQNVGNNINFGNSALQLIDFKNLHHSTTPMPTATSSNKLDKDNIGQHVSQLVHLSQQQQQQNPDMDLQTATLLSSGSVMPGMNQESQRVGNQTATIQQNNSDTVLNQTLASLWGIIGYPSYPYS